MMKTILTAEQQAKAHADAARALKSAWIDQLDNFDLSAAEWDSVWHKIELAEEKLRGRHEALWDLRNDLLYSPNAYIDVKYKRMNASWYKYYLLADKLEKTA